MEKYDNMMMMFARSASMELRRKLVSLKHWDAYKKDVSKYHCLPDDSEHEVQKYLRLVFIGMMRHVSIQEFEAVELKYWKFALLYRFGSYAVSWSFEGYMEKWQQVYILLNHDIELNGSVRHALGNKVRLRNIVSSEIADGMREALGVSVLPYVVCP